MLLWRLQFVELKGSVFKRFEKNNLFQMACSGMITKLNEQTDGIQFKLLRRHVLVDCRKFYVTFYLCFLLNVSHAAEKSTLLFNQSGAVSIVMCMFVFPRLPRVTYFCCKLLLVHFVMCALWLVRWGGNDYNSQEKWVVSQFDSVLLTALYKFLLFFHADIRERFYYIVLVSIVTLRNLTEFNWNLGK